MTPQLCTLSFTLLRVFTLISSELQIWVSLTLKDKIQKIKTSLCTHLHSHIPMLLEKHSDSTWSNPKGPSLIHLLECPRVCCPLSELNKWHFFYLLLPPFRLLVQGSFSPGTWGRHNAFMRVGWCTEMGPVRSGLFMRGSIWVRWNIGIISTTYPKYSPFFNF